MDQSEKSIAKIEAEVNKTGTEKSLPFVEDVNKAAGTLIENVKSSSTVTQLEKEVEKFVADPWASLKNLRTVEPESFSGSTKDVVVTTSDKNVEESSDIAKPLLDKTISEDKPENADIDENPRSMHTQPFIAVAADGNASWVNCCGLLDVLKCSEK